MLKLSSITMVIAVALALVAPNVAVATIYTGSLSTDGGADGLLVGLGQSWGAGSTLAWIVDTAAAPGEVSYTYTLAVADVSAAGISHASVEVSCDFTQDDLISTDWPGASIIVGLLAPDMGSPHLPSSMCGIKFNDYINGKVLTWSFNTTRLPVWGDFYAKGGDANELWNAGFVFGEGLGQAGNDPVDPVLYPVASGSALDHLLVPDTEVSVPPQRGTMSVFKFEDLNQNGVWDAATESLLDGWSFEASGPETKSGDTVGGLVTLDLLAGLYDVTETLEAGWTFTGSYWIDPNNPGARIPTPSNGNPLTGVEVFNGKVTSVFFGNIPEPASLAFMCLGGVGVLLRRRRWR